MMIRLVTYTDPVIIHCHLLDETQPNTLYYSCLPRNYFLNTTAVKPIPQVKVTVFLFFFIFYFIIARHE